MNTRFKKRNDEKQNIISDEELLSSPDDILNETIFTENPIEEKELPGKAGSASQDREQKKKYKGFVSSPDDIKRFSMFGAKILLNVNGAIRDARKHLSEKEAISIVEPSYRLIDRNVISKLKDAMPEIGDDNLNDAKEIVSALISWGTRAMLVTIFDYTARTEEKTAKSQLNTFNMQQELRRRQAQAHKEFEEKNSKQEEEPFTGGTFSRDDSLNMISIDPNQLDPTFIGPENDGAYGV